MHNTILPRQATAIPRQARPRLVTPSRRARFEALQEVPLEAPLSARSRAMPAAAPRSGLASAHCAVQCVAARLAVRALVIDAMTGGPDEKGLDKRAAGMLSLRMRSTAGYRAASRFTARADGVPTGDGAGTPASRDFGGPGGTGSMGCRSGALLRPARCLGR